MAKPTVIKDGPGTVIDRRARLHDALDEIFDRKAAQDEYRFAKPPAKPRPLMSVTSKEDLAKMAAKGGSELHKKVGDAALSAAAEIKEMQALNNKGAGRTAAETARALALSKRYLDAAQYKAKDSSTVWKRGMRVVNKATGEKGSYASNVGGGKAAVESDSRKGDLAYWRFDDIEPTRKAGDADLRARLRDAVRAAR